MAYLLNNLNDIQAVYTPDIQYLKDEWIGKLSDFPISEVTIINSMKFFQYYSYGDDYEKEHLSFQEFDFKNKNHKYCGINYDYLLKNIDLDVFKTELDKKISNQEKSFIKEIEDTLENSNSDIKFNKYFKNKIENLSKSENCLKTLVSNQNEFIQLVITRYLESFSKTHNQLRKEYFDLLPQYFEVKKINTFDNSIQINQHKINDNDLLLKRIDDYNIFSLYSLESRLVGQVVTITFDNPIYDEELDCTYTIDEVELILSQYNIQDERDREYDENDYRHYANELSDDVRTWKLQKLNYEDFITHSNDFKDVVKQKLIDIENEILKLIPEFISKNIEKIENIKHLINFTIIKKWNKHNLALLNRFHDNEFVMVSYKNIRKIPLITDVMNIVYDRKEDFIQKIKNEFSFYYVEEYHETEFEKSLKKMDIKFKTDFVLKHEITLTEVLTEPIKKLTECGFYKILQAKYPERDKQQSIIATLFRIHLKSTNIKYDIITTGTHYYNFCSAIGLISHLEKNEFKNGLEIAKLLNAFSKSNDKNLKEITIKSLENNHTYRETPISQYYPFSNSSNNKVSIILMKLNLI